MTFTPIELRTWPRGQVFYYFSQMAPTGYSLTVEVDITHLYGAFHDDDKTSSLMWTEFDAGKFYESEGKLLLPLSLTCHHAAADGYHVARFLRQLQEDMDRFAV